MNKTVETKIVKKLFFAWGEEKEKLFLEEMALQGYKLVNVGFGKYYFEKYEPKKLVYQFDFRVFDKMKEEEYIQIYEDAGWNFIARFGGWYYFYQEYNEEIGLTLFNDNASIRAKYRRLLFFLLLTGFPLYYQTIILFPTLDRAKLEFPGFYFFFRILVSILAVLHVLALIKIFSKYKKLDDNMKE